MLIRRPAARVLVFTSDEYVLLLRTWKMGDPEPDWWYTPGGGVDEGESFEVAAAREVFEETGTEADIGRCCWTRHREVPDRGYVAMEQFHVARVDERFEPRPVDPEWQTRGVHFRFKWFSMDDIRTSPDRFDPPQMRELLCKMLRHEGPAIHLEHAPMR